MWKIFGRRENRAPIYFTNTLSGKKELFVPRRPGIATLYSCGPTVYGEQHIGNLRTTAVFSDTLARVLLQAGYQLRRVTNITDVGHMVGDGDEGEDKMAAGAKRDKTTPEEVAKKYTDIYLNDLRALNLDLHSILFPRASEYIKEQIAFIEALEKKGYTYTTSDGVYFDASAFPAYGKLGGVKGVMQEAGVRVAVGEKKNPHDFALWRNAKPNDLQQWDSPWGKGNPGWHIECSAMSRSLLGDELDIHSGGQDLISVHHNNEIAQTESLTGRPFARYWLHGAFLTIDGVKISKSIGNVHTLSEIVARGYHPLALRYFFLQAHYRSPVNFTWNALAAANEGLHALWKAAARVKKESKGRARASDMRDRLVAVVRDDLKTAQGLALLSEALKSDELSPAEVWGVIESADALFGLSLTNPPELPEALSADRLPPDIRALAEKREDARRNKDFAESDRLRIHIEESGYRVDDGATETTYTKTSR